MSLDVFTVFPHICSLGQHRLQELCDERAQSPVARECGVHKLVVEEDLSLDGQCEISHQIADGETWHFPVDQLLRYIAEKGIEPDEIREAVLADIVKRRTLVGSTVYQRFKFRAKRLYMTCKTPGCDNIMQYQIPRGGRIVNLPFKGECPSCLDVHEYGEGDLRDSPS